jgi:hypothetical protein
MAHSVVPAATLWKMIRGVSRQSLETAPSSIRSRTARSPAATARQEARECTPQLHVGHDASVRRFAELAPVPR